VAQYKDDEYNSESRFNFLIVRIFGVATSAADIVRERRDNKRDLSAREYVSIIYLFIYLFIAELIDF